jgi:hypothetical protein
LPPEEDEPPLEVLPPEEVEPPLEVLPPPEPVDPPLEVLPPEEDEPPLEVLPPEPVDPPVELLPPEAEPPEPPVPGDAPQPAIASAKLRPVSVSLKSLVDCMFFPSMARACDGPVRFPTSKRQRPSRLSGPSPCGEAFLSRGSVVATT